jgi:hypothetical protein
LNVLIEEEEIFKNINKNLLFMQAYFTVHDNCFKQVLFHVDPYKTNFFNKSYTDKKKEIIRRLIVLWNILKLWKYFQNKAKKQLLEEFINAVSSP